MSKNKKKNAFFCFMIDWKANQERKGRTFPNGLKDVMADAKCNEEWKNLDEEQKLYYKNMAKQSNEKVPKKTAVGEFVDEIKEAEEREQQFQEDMKEYLKHLVEEASTRKAVPKITFYLIHVNYFYIRTLNDNTLEYCPAEIAIAECSLQDGVKRVFHALIKPDIKVGYTSDAMEMSRSTHQLPTEPNDDLTSKECNADLYWEIYNFLKPARVNNRMPPLYTQYYEDKDIKFPVVNVMDTLAATERYLEPFRIYSLEELFANLNNIAGAEPIDSMGAHLILKKDPYDYKPSTECEFHQIVGGGNFCSMSLVQRWMFIVCSTCCPLFKITMRPGLHEPKENGQPDEAVQDISNALDAWQFPKKSVPRSVQPIVSTGAVRKYTKNSSERTQAEEDLRRYVSASEPPDFSIIQNSHLDDEQEAAAQFTNAAGRGRGVPPQIRASGGPAPQVRASAWAPIPVQSNTYDNDFPVMSIGRGAVRRKNNPSNKPGGNYASKLR